MIRLRGPLHWAALVTLGLAGLVLAAAWIFRGDISQALLDPEIPYAVYKPPPAPDYALASSWALLPGPPRAGDPPADVFFVHPTTFDGGKDWNGPIADGKSAAVLARSMLPNYAAPFAAAGRLYAPRYRQASLYTSRTMFDDAIEARQFAYGDVRAAFAAFLARTPPDRPFILAGVEQGGLLASRLLAEVIAPDPALRRRLIGVWLIETAAPQGAYADQAAIPPCARRAQAGCLVAWISAPRLDFIRVQRIRDRSLVWNPGGRLVPLGGRAIVCVNPLLGAQSEDAAPERLNLGAVNATGLELGTRPAFMVREVSAQCVDGVLRVSRPASGALLPAGSWAERLRQPSFNLFWGDIEADALARAAAWRAQARSPLSPPPMPSRPSASQTARSAP